MSVVETTLLTKKRMNKNNESGGSKSRMLNNHPSFLIKQSLKENEKVRCSLI